MRLSGIRQPLANVSIVLLSKELLNLEEVGDPVTQPHSVL